MNPTWTIGNIGLLLLGVYLLSALLAFGYSWWLADPYEYWGEFWRKNVYIILLPALNTFAVVIMTMSLPLGIFLSSEWWAKRRYKYVKGKK